jgi:hypothetical protein
MLASAIDGPRLQAPPRLLPEAVETWNSIVGQFEPGHFGNDHVHLLVQLCEHVSYSRQISEALAEMRHERLTLTTAAAAKRRQVFCDLLKAHREESRSIISLSLKLRLCPSSWRRDSQTNERKFRTVPSGRPPWQSS